MGSRQYEYDANLQLSDGLVAYTADGAATVGGTAVVLDLLSGGGATTAYTQLAAADAPRFEGVLVVNLTSISVTSGLAYRLTVQGSNDASFPASGVSENLASMDFGVSASRDGQLSVAKTTPVPAGTSSLGIALSFGNMYELPFVNEQGGFAYRYVRLWVDLTGAGSIGFSAFVASKY